jgi:hypothetical protein
MLRDYYRIQHIPMDVCYDGLDARMRCIIDIPTHQSTSPLSPRPPTLAASLRSSLLTTEKPMTPSAIKPQHAVIHRKSVSHAWQHGGSTVMTRVGIKFTFYKRRTSTAAVNFANIKTRLLCSDLLPRRLLTKMNDFTQWQTT